jgi:hypothetical protein
LYDEVKGSIHDELYSGGGEDDFDLQDPELITAQVESEILLQRTKAAVKDQAEEIVDELEAFKAHLPRMKEILEPEIAYKRKDFLIFEAKTFGQQILCFIQNTVEIDLFVAVIVVSLLYPQAGGIFFIIFT